MWWLWGGLATLFFLFVWMVVIRPYILISASGINISLPSFYQLQSRKFPMIRLLIIAKKFKSEGIVLTWSDIELFYQSASIEIEANPEKFQKPAVELFQDVLETMVLVKSEGYELSWNHTVMQILSGKNPREITAAFVHLMWKSKAR